MDTTSFLCNSKSRFRTISPSQNPNFLFFHNHSLSSQIAYVSFANQLNFPSYFAGIHSPISPTFKFRHGFPKLLSRKSRFSSGDSQSFVDGKSEEIESPSFVEFLTSERVKVVMMLALALVLCNADRVVMSVAIVPLSQSNGWSQAFAGVVQSSFLWGYLVSPIAGGALVDYYGGKTVMGWGVAMWSFATFLTPWAAEKSLWALLATRATVGIAEGVALPSMNNMISKWFPRVERAKAVGIAMAGFQLGSAIGLVLSPILMSNAGVFGPFVIFGLSGFLWVVVWLSATSSIPERSPQISSYELNYILSERKKLSSSNAGKTHKAFVIPPFRRMLSKLPTWSLMVANAMHSWGFFVILSWMPIYFKSVYHVDLSHAAWFSAVPWTMMAFVGYFAGAWSDMLIQRGLSVTLTRKIMQSIGFFGPGVALFGLTSASSPMIASAWLTLAVGLKSFSHSGFLVNIQEIAPQYTGVLHGLANTAGTSAAIIGTVGAGFFVEWFGSFRGFLWLTSCLYFLSALFWNLFSTGEPVDFDASTLGYNSKSDAPEVDQGYGVRNSNQIHSNSSGFSSRSKKEGSSTRQPDSFNPSESSSGEVFGSLNFTLQDINQATKNFSQNNVIGDGGFGTVYKGQLKDGTLVAIKRAKKELYDKRTAQEFKSEVLAYSKIEHLNLVKFYGYLEHLDEKIIAVEYVSNGTLFDHLHGNQGQGRVLELAERLDISVDVAHAITYLHTYNDPPIIHRDIKASNILITEKLRAKVADFGLARFVPEGPDVTHISTQIKGTAGYLDPEYMKSYQLTEKSDVYSFGVLLVELMTGRHPIEPCKGVKERVTIRWAMNKLREGMPVLAMDPRLNRSPSSIKVVKNILELAQKCTGPVRQSRPSMKDCVEVLWAIRKELKEGTQLNYSASHRSVDLLQNEARKVRQESLGIEGETYSFMSA